MDSILINEIEEYVKNVVSVKRYEHSVRTAQTLVLLCERYGLDKEKGYLAGIAHDMCKEINTDLMVELAKKDGKKITLLEQEKKSLLHGRAAAVLIEEKFGVTDVDIKEAIANHTFGGSCLCDLGKLLFVADKIEPGRPQSTDEYRHKLFSLNLDEITYSVVQENIDYLEKRGKVVAPVSFMLRDELLESLKVEHSNLIHKV